METVLQHTGV